MPDTDVTDLRRYTRVVVITGAGISAASGIPTYRQAGSGWTDPDLERISHARAYGNHLPRLWEFWGTLRARTAGAAPNAAHHALAAAQRRCSDAGGWLLIGTQNIDGLHHAAGSSGVTELHGSIHRSRCIRTGCGPAFDDDRIPAAGQIPPCPRCGRPTRPDVVLFGEQLLARTVKTVTGALRRAELCLYVGTSGEVHPVSDLVSTGRRAGARCVLVNAAPWTHPHPDFHDTLLGPAENLLPGLLG